MSAQSSGLPVVADERTLRETWPAYYEAPVARTPIGGVIGIPLQRELRGVGALDLCTVPPRNVRSVRLTDALEVAREVVQAFDDISRWTSRSGDGPAWLHAPAVEFRAVVWQTMGFLSSALQIDGLDALALLRAHAYSRGRNVDEVAALVISRELPAAGFSFDAADD